MTSATFGIVDYRFLQEPGIVINTGIVRSLETTATFEAQNAEIRYKMTTVSHSTCHDNLDATGGVMSRPEQNLSRN